LHSPRIQPLSEPYFPTDEVRAAGDFDVAYLCIFCGETIAEDAPDFCELNFSVGAGFGTFTCHVGCLRDRSHDPSTFPDLLTPAERPPDYVEPSPELLRAWDEFSEVLGQLHHAELDTPEHVRGVMQAVIEAAERNGIEIEPLPPDDPPDTDMTRP
jgi:hypothetical protein